MGSVDAFVGGGFICIYDRANVCVTLHKGLYRFKIYILPDQRKEGGSEADLQNRVFNLVFLLNLSALGDLRIETKMFKDDISIQIISSNSSAVQFIQSHVSELEDMFRQEGFSINVTSGFQTEVSMEVPDSLGQLLIDTPLQIVDLKT